MSEKIDITIDSSTDVEAGNEIVSTSSDNNIDIEILEPDYNVTINKREYVITGDNMYIPKTYDESPQWLKDIIGTITDFSLNQKLTEIGALSNTLYGLIDELNAAKNTYTNSIITSAEIDERINARIETLNSSIAESDATIVDMIATKATPTEASSLALNVLTASINDGAISSLVSNLQNAISTTNSTLSNNIDIVHSEMTGDFEATSDAVSGLQTYIGVDNDGGLTGTGLLSKVDILEKQNDGVIETTTGTYDVMIGIEDPNNNTDNDQLDTSKEPYATWKALDAVSGDTKNRSSHVGDVYIKYTDAAEGYKTYDKAYKFIRTIPDSTSPFSTDTEGFTWAVITDTDVQNAYVAALNALDLADSKRRVFVDTPTVPYDIGDLWIKAVSGGNQLYKSGSNRTDSYNSVDWAIADDAQVNNFVSEIYEPDMLDLQKQIDGQLNYYFYESSLAQTPASTSGSAGWNAESKKEHHGDIAYDRTTNTGYYYYKVTSSWIAITGSENAGVIEALKAASLAKATADGKVSHMYGVYQSTSPATTGAYKYWLTTAKVLKVLEGASWVDFAISKLDTGDIVTVWDSVLKDEFKYYWNGNTWYSQVNGGLVAGSKAFTDLDTSLSSLEATVSGHTGQLSTVDSRIVNGVATVDSKWQYNSNLIINGVPYNSGFGLSNSAGTGVGSEFWIDASKLKFTNSAKTGRTAPFTIDASTATPEITFNGKVSFSNVTDVPVPSTSIISSNWSIGSGATGIFNINGTTAENYRVYGDNHLGQRVVLWECRPDSVSDADGGWDTNTFAIDNSKTYRFSVFVKTNASTGYVYLGCQSSSVTTLNTTTKDENPYFWYGDLPTQNEWYLIVGYVYPSGQTGLTHKGGIYSCVDGKKVSTITDFNWASDATTGLHRCYHFYDTNTTTRQWMWNPRVDIIDGNEPSIIDLIGKADVSSDISANNDVFAQKLGYLNYASMVAAASSGQTIINGGYVNTSLLQANSIVASKINTVGLIAENISANEIVGKTIKSSTLESTTINARDIKIITDAGLYTKSVIGAKSIKSINSSTSITFYFELYKYNSTTINKQYFAKSSGNFLNLSGSTLLSAISSPASYNGYICIAYTSITSGTSFSITIDGYTTSIQTPSSGNAITIIHQTGIEFVAFKPGGLNYVGLFASNVSSFSLVNSDNLSITISTSSTFIGGYDFFATAYNI